MSAENDLWIFREARDTVFTAVAVQELRNAIGKFLRGRDKTDGVNALIRAGQLESALADANSTAVTHFSAVTDRIAAALYGNFSQPSSTVDSMDRVEVPGTISVSTPEGFAYYALSPFDFSNSASNLISRSKSVLVIGIRSIGTTLSAITRAALKKSNRKCERMTVRPTGHPYDRLAQFTPEQTQAIEKFTHEAAEFLVVDEGPGRSGSSFLSVAEALVAVGVDARRIFLLGSAEPDLTQLRARNAASRWKKFQYHSAEFRYAKRFQHCTNLSGGEWRRILIGAHPHWPASWRQMERLKFLSHDQKLFLKFEGLGPLQKSARDRAECLAQAGFCPRTDDSQDGFLSYRFISGRPFMKADISITTLEHIAKYCAFRASAFRTSHDNAEPLYNMRRANIQNEFGIAWNGEFERLQTQTPILTDGRMQPHEWIRSTDGSIFKTDAISHGDDHFFPGPCDIAWDLAGVAVEWSLTSDTLELLLARFRQLTGDDVRPRLTEFLLAYSVFRLGYCKMAAESENDLQERARLEKAYRRYRGYAGKHLARLWPGANVHPFRRAPSQSVCHSLE